MLLLLLYRQRSTSGVVVEVDTRRNDNLGVADDRVKNFQLLQLDSAEARVVVVYYD